ncbi:phage tail tape measure protein [Rhodoligotrophos defluvii]|uniref:phage tail tape measure protein n=1 Tax=Rhodoligotrophos defluvii TaxID=2561934 RepID=UPI0010C9DE20|nr:phage tail tape measure protein [Rhodoligotrophos defluvii]
MAEEIEGLNVSIALDSTQFRKDLEEVGRLTAGFERSMARVFTNAAISGRKLDDVLRSLILSLSRQTLTAALRPLTQGIGTALTSAISGLTANARGNVFTGGVLKPFADGGVVNGPTLFPLRGGTGLMGEAGPEAILPLARGADGRLGVRSDGAGARPIHITFNVTTPDVAGFRRSQSEIGAILARAMARGQRNL